MSYIKQSQIYLRDPGQELSTICKNRIVIRLICRNEKKLVYLIQVLEVS